MCNKKKNDYSWVIEDPAVWKEYTISHCPMVMTNRGKWIYGITGNVHVYVFVGGVGGHQPGPLSSLLLSSKREGIACSFQIATTFLCVHLSAPRSLPPSCKLRDSTFVFKTCFVFTWLFLMFFPFFFQTKVWFRRRCGGRNRVSTSVAGIQYNVLCVAIWGRVFQYSQRAYTRTSNNFPFLIYKSNHL